MKPQTQKEAPDATWKYSEKKCKQRVDRLFSLEQNACKQRAREVGFICIFLRNVTIQALINTRNSLKLRRVQSS